ncbi:MAG: carboxyltransferase subunit alpha [Clostridia bacterium]
MNAYDRVKETRAKGRMTAEGYISGLVQDFVEMHGDRRFGDDRAIIAGIGRIAGRPVTVVGIEKGQDTQDKVKRSFGSAHPEGYRKALRQFLLAEKFGRPVLCIVDTAGAFCGIDAEERGQGQAIAENLEVLMGLKVPVLSVVIGEGGSGGALALAVADRVWMLENAYYSVISPEGAASILWKDAGRAADAAQCLKLTSEDLMAFGVIEKIIPEPGALVALEKALPEEIERLARMDGAQRLAQRYEKFRKIGGGFQ